MILSNVLSGVGAATKCALIRHIVPECNDHLFHTPDSLGPIALIVLILGPLLVFVEILFFVFLDF